MLAPPLGLLAWLLWRENVDPLLSLPSYYIERTTSPRSMLRPHPLQEVDHGAAHSLAFDMLKGFKESESLGSR